MRFLKTRVVYLIGFILVVVLAACAGILLGKRPIVTPKTLVIGNQGLTIGQKAPDFELPSLTSSSSITLKTAKGKPIILTFFASWCTPCKTDIPTIESFYRQNQNQISVIGIDTGDTKSAALNFVKSYDLTFPIGYDPTQELANVLYLIPGMPTTYFISDSHQVLGIQIGIVRPSLLQTWKQLFPKKASN
jgi:peroxiredoxin